MPRRAKGPRLWLRPARRDGTGAITHFPTWFVLDGPDQRSTGLGIGATADEKEKALNAYLTEKLLDVRKVGLKDPTNIKVDEVLILYADEKIAKHSDPDKTKSRIRFLKAFWAGKMLSDVTGATCREYARTRPEQAARRELEDLRAAIIYHRREGLHDRIVSVVLPPRSLPRERWMTRKEAAHLIRTAWHHRVTAGQGAVNYPHRHIARFMLVARYMGSRASVICSASIEPRRPKDKAWIDLTNGVFYGRPEGERETSKRKQTVQAPPELLVHLRRWQRFGQRYVVEWNGKPVGSVKKGHAAAVKNAVAMAAAKKTPMKFDPGVTQHTWRHSVATWLMQGGAPESDIADFLGMRVEVLRRVYGHHRPENSASVHTAFRAHRARKRAAKG